MSDKKENPFIISQLDEALEERQRPDRRQEDLGHQTVAEQERRKGDRRTIAAK